MRTRGLASFVALLIACGSNPVNNDAGVLDAGTADAGTRDAGTPDAGTQDAGTPDAGRPWNPNEVSILFPFPTDAGQLLAMHTAMDAGDHVLLPAELFHRLGDPDGGLPRLVEGAGNRDLYPELRVVSARIDPCFDATTPCVHQVRLVVQALNATPLTFSDAAVHLFYTLDDSQFIDVLARIRALSRGTAVTGPLGIHPILARDEAQGPFSDEVKAILLSACSTANLTRFTVMATGRSKNWFFFILDRGADGGFESSQIPGTTTQDSFTDQGNKYFRMGIPFNVAWFPDALLTTPATRALTDANFLLAFDQLEKLINPSLTRTRDVSCAACHAAESIEVESLRDRDAGLPASSASSYGPLKTSAYRLGNMHAFSFFFDAPAISHRTQNETAEVIRFLESAAFLNSLSAQDRARLE